MTIVFFITNDNMVRLFLPMERVILPTHYGADHINILDHRPWVSHAWCLESLSTLQFLTLWKPSNKTYISLGTTTKNSHANSCFNKVYISFMPIVNALAPFLEIWWISHFFVDEEAEKTETAEKVETALPEVKTEAAPSTWIVSSWLCFGNHWKSRSLLDGELL